MLPRFTSFAIVGYPRNAQSYSVHREIFQFFKQRNLAVWLEQELQAHLPDFADQDFLTAEQIGSQADLIIVVGGDGNMLRAAVKYANYDIPVIGVNKGNLGFLTDLDPGATLEQHLEQLLDPNNYTIEERNLLSCKFFDAELGSHQELIACNELAFSGNSENRIVEIEVFIDKKTAFGMRGDGLIISTPSGSTAYNLSSGGPIVHPAVNAIVLTQLNPHTLTARPVVVPANSEIEIHFKGDCLYETTDVYCDGVLIKSKYQDKQLMVTSAPHRVKMVHLTDYNYYRVLAKKLGWARRLF